MTEVTEAPLVVLVDDDSNDEELARLALAKSGVEHHLRVASDGAEALSLLLPAVGAVRPRLILLDLKMPKVGGLEVLSLVRADWRMKSVPIVVFTSSAEERDISQSYERGANAYVRKPIDFTEYSATVAALAGFWLKCNVLPKGGGEPSTEGPLAD